VLYLVHRGYGASLAAGAVSVYVAGKMAAGPPGGLLTGRLGARVTTAGSMACSAAATMALAAVSGPVLIMITAGLTGLVSQLYRPVRHRLPGAGAVHPGGVPGGRIPDSGLGPEPAPAPRLAAHPGCAPPGR
jgi:hypothetical protein